MPIGIIYKFTILAKIKSTYAHRFKRTNEQKEKIRNGLLRYYANVSKQS